MNAFASLISFIEALAALFHPRTVTGVPNEVDIKALIGSPLHLAAATLVFYVIPLAIACFIISLFLGLLVIALLFVIAFICEGEAWLGGYEHQELRGVTNTCLELRRIVTEVWGNHPEEYKVPFLKAFFDGLRYEQKAQQ